MASAFASRTSKQGKAGRGRTAAEQTPIAIRSRVELAPRLPERIRTQLARRLGHAARHVERGTVRFDDVNGPRGGVDTVCRIKLVLSGQPSVQVEERAAEPATAFARALPKLTRSLARTREKRAGSTRRTAATKRTHRRAPSRTKAKSHGRRRAR